MRRNVVLGVVGVALLLSLSFGVSMMLGRIDRQENVAKKRISDDAKRTATQRAIDPSDQPKLATGSRPQPRAKSQVSMTAFRQKCWREDKPLPRYAGEPIRRLSIAVPANGEAETPFNFCVEWLSVDGKKIAWTSGGQLNPQASSALGTGAKWGIRSDTFTKWELPASPNELSSLVKEDTPICVRGIAPKVEEARYASMWGMTVGMDLEAEAESGLSPKWETIEIGISGDSVPEQLRLQLEDTKAPGKGKVWCKFVDLTPVSPI